MVTATLHTALSSLLTPLCLRTKDTDGHRLISLIYNINIVAKYFREERAREGGQFEISFSDVKENNDSERRNDDGGSFIFVK